MKLKNALLSMTATAMLAAPVAAQAGTTASASTGKIASLSSIGERKSTSVKAKQNVDSSIVILGLLGAGAGAYGIYKAVDNGDKSNGS
jgi:hypothetical protein